MKRLGVALALAGAVMMVTPGMAQAKNVTVMTRNVYLGAELRSLFETIGARTTAQSPYDLSATGGEIFRRVASTNFPVRAKGLAQEIQQRTPDVIGVQEAALWRRGPVDFQAAFEQRPSAQNVYQDFVEILLAEVNRGPVRYRVVDVADQRDFEVPADMDNNPRTGQSGADANLRLTLRNAILVRDTSDIQVKDVKSGHYTKKNSLITYFPGGVKITSLRGWQTARIKVGSGPWFTFANTHLEALDPQTVFPSIRARQAREFARMLGAVKGPTIATGDLNSDSPSGKPGGAQAFNTLMRNGFADIGTKTPSSCCVNSDDLTHGGSVTDFSQRVDHILTTTPTKVKKVKTWVVGRAKSFGYWHSDHAGIVGKYRLK